MSIGNQKPDFMTQIIETKGTYLAFKQVFSQHLPNFFKTIGLAILSAACYGISVVMTKQSLADFSPLVVLVIQSTSSIIFLWITWKIGLTGLLEPGLAYVFGTIGLNLTTASNATLISVSEPIITILLAAIFLKERLPSSLIYLSLLATAGVALVASPNVNEVSQNFIGDLLILLGVLCASLYAIVTRNLVDRVKPLPLAAMQQTFALMWFGLLLSLSLFFHPSTINISQINFAQIPTIILSGIIGQALAFWLYLTAIEKQGVSITSLYLTLIPLFGVVTAYITLGERLSTIQTIGGGIILAVVVSISQLPQKTQ
jgi:drug/metabolite transporter (DMT)-like permease